MIGMVIEVGSYMRKKFYKEKVFDWIVLLTICCYLIYEFCLLIISMFSLNKFRSIM